MDAAKRATADVATADVATADVALPPPTWASPPRRPRSLLFSLLHFPLVLVTAPRVWGRAMWRGKAAARAAHLDRRCFSELEPGYESIGNAASSSLKGRTILVTGSTE
jgi:hypothetical protein